MTDRNTEALPLVEKSLALDPDNTAALHTKGVILLNYGESVGAEKSFDRALELDPTHVDSLYEKGRCLVRQNKIENALKYLEKAIELGGKEYVDKAKSEKNFDILKDDEKFVHMVKIYQS
jgi:tetratricopeptide (TPR) repeat protein